MFGLDLAHQASHRRFISDVDVDGSPIDGRGHVLGRAPVAVDYDDRSCFLGGEAAAHRGADPGSGARDHDNAAIDSYSKCPPGLLGPKPGPP